jgi:inorganic pyrophosphatase
MAELGVGKNAPDEVNIVIEIRRGDRNKYEMDKETGYITLDRVTGVSMNYPTDYGYLPGTLCEDGDPLDALLVIAESVPHGVVVAARPVGVLRMVDAGENDEKLICVPVHDITSDHIKELDDLEPNFKQIVEHYYSHYKDWKNGWKGADVRFDGWGDAAAAKQVITDSIARVKTKA